MTGKTHIASGVLAVLVYSYIKDDPNNILLMSGGIIGSLIPDIDNQHSTLSKILPFISKPWAFIRKKAKEWRFKIAGEILEHRGFTHSLLFIAILGFIFYSTGLITNSFAVGLLLGIFSHIAVDLLNDVGVPLLSPLIFKKINIATITTGKSVETIFFIGVWVINFVFIALIINTQYPDLLPFL